jgi:3-deoxy-7-phosphoheptulonate synthase
MSQISDVNILSQVRLSTPRQIKGELPLPGEVEETVMRGRQTVVEILERRDPRLLVITGPCSIHDPEAALDYARRLKSLHDRYRDSLYIVMRVYFQKPRTTVGWKGLINDPHLDGSFDMEEGVRVARQLLLEINGMGLPCASEILDPITPQYFADLISWTAIGARTTESQTHREMSSGLSMPVGFKNGTDGGLQVALDAMVACDNPHAFLGIDESGQIAMIRTRGNPHGHIVLRGGSKRPNYGPEAISETRQRLEEAGLSPVAIVDCSHANSGKKHARQGTVLRAILDQKCEGDNCIIGVMLESNLFEGNQKLNGNRESLKYGVSITDECIGWERTEELLAEAHREMAQCLAKFSTPEPVG